MMNTPNPNRGEVWYVQFDPQVGEEIQKTRPAVVISHSSVGVLPLRLVVPLTKWQTWHRQHIWLVFVPATPMNGLAKDSSADAFQVKSVSLERFCNRIGKLTPVQVDDIAAAIALCIDYP